MTDPLTSRRYEVSGTAAGLIVAGLGLALAQWALQVSDPDTLWHLVLGRRLADTGQFVLPREGLLTADYLYSQWLPELIAARADDLWGLPGVAVLAHVCRAAVLAAVYLLARRSTPPLVAAAITVVVTLAGLGAFTARPQLVGLLAMVVVVGGWRATATDGRARWWVAGVTLLWAASHGTWLIGAAVGAVTVAGLAARARFRDIPRGPLLVVAASTIVGFAMPPGPRWPEELSALHAVAWFADEWQPAPSSSVHLQAFLVLIVVVASLWVRCRHVDPLDALTLGLGLLVGLTAYRGLAFAAVLVTPLIAPVASRQPPPRAPRSERAALVAGLAATVLVAIVSAPHVARDPGRVPVQLTAALRALPSGTVVVNDAAVGGWLLWAHPELIPVLDTRLQAYGPDHLRRAVAAYDAQPGWEEAITSWHAGAALLMQRAPLTTALRTSLGWREAGRDAGYVLLTPPAGSPGGK